MKASSPPGKPADPAAAEALARWFRQEHRPLPWRASYDPYHVWVSEVMLQQTQVETALPFYQRFLERFGSIESLAAATEEEVLRLWSGLGYYSRARNFRAAAARVVAEHGGRLPCDYDALLKLPGIGRYMAGAIMSIAFNQPYPVVDGNVRRVLARFHGWVEPGEHAVWAAAGDMVHKAEPRIVNQAMMELGATVCTPKAPRCLLCPWTGLCAAFRTGRQSEIPAPRKRPATIRVDLCAVIDSNARGVLMREEKGLWEFPLLTEPPAGGFERLGACRHSITHHRIEVQVYRGKLGSRDGYRRVQIDGVAVTSLTRKIFSVFRDSEDAGGKRGHRNHGAGAGF